MAGTWFLGEESIDLTSAGCYCGLLTVEFVPGVGLIVIYMGMCFVWMQSGSGDRAMNDNRGQISH